MPSWIRKQGERIGHSNNRIGIKTFSNQRIKWAAASIEESDLE